jgi:hypothetical protein
MVKSFALDVGCYSRHYVAVMDLSSVVPNIMYKGEDHSMTLRYGLGGFNDKKKNSYSIEILITITSV